MEFISAILHFQLAQDFVDGRWSKGSPSFRISDAKCAQLFRIRLHFGLHALPQPHASHYRHRQKTEQNHRQFKPGTFPYTFSLSLLYLYREKRSKRVTICDWTEKSFKNGIQTSWNFLKRLKTWLLNDKF